MNYQIDTKYNSEAVAKFTKTLQSPAAYKTFTANGG